MNLERFSAPHEFHVTVDPESDVKQFQAACGELGVKGLEIYNITSDGLVIPDLITSSHKTCTTTLAYAELARISESLSIAGFDVVREKIETVPWHPMAPSRQFPYMPFGKYFESHIEVPDPDFIKLLDISYAEGLPLLISANAAKPESQFATLRSYSMNAEEFIGITEETAEILGLYYRGIGSPVVEFAMHDTAVVHDFEWLASYGELPPLPPIAVIGMEVVY